MSKEDTKGEEIDNIAVLNKVTSSIKEFKHINIDPKYENFSVMFINLYLVHFTKSRNQYYNSYSSAICEISTVNNKALAMIFLKNHVDGFNNTINLKRKLTRKKSRPRYNQP